MKKSYLTVALAEVFWTPDDFDRFEEFVDFEPTAEVIMEAAVTEMGLQSKDADALFFTQVGDNCCGEDVDVHNVVVRCRNCDCEIEPSVVFDKRKK